MRRSKSPWAATTNNAIGILHVSKKAPQKRGFFELSNDAN